MPRPGWRKQPTECNVEIQPCTPSVGVEPVNFSLGFLWVVFAIPGEACLSGADRHLCLHKRGSPLPPPLLINYGLTFDQLWANILD
eukprot:994674-Prorocentrum_minimum.AAC.1